MTERRFVNQHTGEVVENPPIRPFRETLSDLGEGSTERELAEAMWDLLQRVQDTGKAGSVTLVVNVALNGAGRVEMKDEVKIKLPEYTRPTTSFFIDKTGNASRRDPNQPDLPGIAQINSQREAN